MRHLDSLTAIYSRWLRANALPEIGADGLTMQLWQRVADLRGTGSPSHRAMKMRGQLAWLDRFCYLWQMAEARRTPLFEEATKRDEWIAAHAAYFTAIRGVGRKRSRHEFATKTEALAAQPGDGRTMIYAVASDGSSAHLCNI